MNINVQSEAYERGYAAFTSGANNPFIAGSQEYTDWRAGYGQALRDDMSIW